MVSALPLFPLPLVLFPGVHLPLHIFEPRYRRMLADCMAGDRNFGVIFRPEGVREQEIPAGQVGCVAHVERAEMLPDGRANILVVGTARFALEGFEPTALPYSVGRVVGVRGCAGERGRARAARRGVRALFVRVGTAARSLDDDSDALPDAPRRLRPVGVCHRRRHRHGCRRAPAVARVPVAGRLASARSSCSMAPAVEALESRAVVHARAKSNGHGPQPQSPG